MEDKKSNQMKAKQNLKSEQIPDLYVTEYKNNIVELMNIVLRKDKEIMRWDSRLKTSSSTL